MFRMFFFQSYDDTSVCIKAENESTVISILNKELEKNKHMA